MKKTIIKSIAGFTGMASLLLACAEADTIFNQILWSGSMMAIATISVKVVEVNLSEEEKEEQV
jgi:hypothetical protein